MQTRDLAILELKLRIERETIHAQNAMRRLTTAQPSDRIRRAGHGTQRSSALSWRRAKRAMRSIQRSKIQLEKLINS